MYAVPFHSKRYPLIFSVGRFPILKIPVGLFFIKGHTLTVAEKAAKVWLKFGNGGQGTV